MNKQMVHFSLVIMIRENYELWLKLFWLVHVMVHDLKEFQFFCLLTQF